jgi:hypothetical protein
VSGWRLGVVLAAVLPALAAQSVGASYLVTGEARFGAPFALVVERRAPAECTFVPFPADALLPFELKAPVVDERVEGGQRVEQRRFVARAFAVGDVAAPPLVTHARRNDGGLLALPAITVVVPVGSRLPDPDPGLEWPADAFEPRRVGSAVLWWALAATLGAVFFVRHRRRREGVPPPAASAPAKPWSLDDEFAALPVPDDGDATAYYLGLKRIARTACRVRADVPAEVQTSEELLCTLGEVAPGREWAPARDLLRACDGVLFAARRPSRAEHEQSRESLRRFVEQLPTRDRAAGGRA